MQSTAFQSARTLPVVSSQPHALSQTAARRKRACVQHVQASATLTEDAVKDSVRGASKKAKLGSSDLLVSNCCLGTMTWGQQNTEQDAHRQLGYALDGGVNFIDTAEMYPVPTKEDTQGRTDRYIGSWMKGQRRDDIVLATKVTGYGNKYMMKKRKEDTDSDETEDFEVTRLSAKQIRNSVDASLQRLKTDHIDLLQLHWPDRYVSIFGTSGYDPSKERDDIPFEEQLQGLDDVIKAGKVRYVGVSNESSYGVMKFLTAAEQLGLPRIVSIQNAHSLLVRSSWETDLMETCSPNRGNVGLLAYSPLAGGSLSGKYAKGEPPKNSRFTLFPGYMGRYNKSLAKEAVAKYIEIAQDFGLTGTQLALAWVSSQWYVASTIIGATSMEHLKENIGAFDVELPEECLKAINAVYQRYKDPANRPVDE
ncbi:hypothetical protein WJX73_006861 [Symbiochloris irregularis]|uniref:NADP-dependent oxidoreductase domain-containing protein n=1 Tax=Symbiochloris irregularis TaxID=706552 RepID=A0AAW1P233_9CHLO